MNTQNRLSPAELRKMFANVPPSPDSVSANKPVVSAAPSPLVGAPPVQEVANEVSGATPSSPDPFQIASALDYIRPTGYVQLVSILPDGNNDITAKTFEMPDELDAAVRWAVEANSALRNVYFSVNPLADRATNKVRREQLAGMDTSHVDIDPDLKAGYASGREKLLAQLPILQASATFVIDSGNGLGVFYRYNQLLPAEKDGQGEKINKQLIQAFGGDKGTHDASRIMRLPGTWNFPDSKKIAKGYPRAVSLARLLYVDSTKVHEPQALADRLPPVTAANLQQVAGANQHNETRAAPNTIDTRPLSESERAEVREDLAACREENHMLAKRWAGNATGLQDATRSGFDMSVGSILKGLGFTYREMAHALQALFPHGKGSENEERDLLRIWEKSHIEFPVPELPNVSRGTRRALAEIVRRLDRLGSRNDVQGLAALVELNFELIARAIERALYIGNNSKYISPDQTSYLAIFTERKFREALLKNGRGMFDPTKLQRDDHDNPTIAPSQVSATILDGIVDELVNHRQIAQVAVSVDMFAAGIQVRRSSDGTGHLIVPFKGFREKAYRSDVINDYREHCSWFDQLLKMMAAARFAPDRRRAFVWMHIQAAWGKGFFVDVLRELGLVIKTTETEIEKAMSGDPVGIDLDAFRYAWVLFVDEFRKLKAEFKVINNEISASAKHRLRTTLPLYVKIFASAETVESLAGEAGVERQFADRFNYLTGKGRIEDRALFKEIGGAQYLESLVGYVAERLNSLVEKFRAMGPTEAARSAERELKEFHAQYGLEQCFGRLDDTIKEFAAEIKNELLKRFATARSSPFGGSRLDFGNYDLKENTKVLVDEEGQYFAVMQNLASLVEAVVQKLGHSERAKVGYKSGTIRGMIADRKPDNQDRHNLRKVERGPHGIEPGERVRVRGVAIGIDEATAKALMGIVEPPDIKCNGSERFPWERDGS